MVEQKMKICTACGTSKPEKDYLVWLTRAEAKRYGYTGERRVEVERSRCGDCRPKKKPLGRLSERQIHKQVLSGDVHATVAAAVIAKKKANALEKQTLAQHRRWAAVKEKPWADVLASLAMELRTNQQRLTYVKKKAEPSPDLLAFLARYTGLLIVKREQMKTERFKLSRAPETWQENFSSSERHELWQLWRAIPMVHKVGGGVPKLWD